MNLDCVNNGGPASLISVPGPLTAGRAVPLPAAAATSLFAWGVRPGEALTVTDGRDDCWRARLEQDGSADRFLLPFEKMPGPVESPVRVVVYQALPEKERFELILQKLTELGVARIVPMETQRSSTRERRDAGQKKSHRWPDVLRRAARQCRRAMIPELTNVAGWREALAEAASWDLGLLLDDRDPARSLRATVFRRTPASVAVLVGPEGGFASEEVEQARNLGIVPVSLGPRILRTETAAIAAVATLQYAVGDLSGES